MMKIGLFMDALPHTGGAFQYNLSMLDAVANLPRGQFSVVVAYTSPRLEQFISPYAVAKIYVDYPFVARVWGIVLNMTHFPLAIWHRLAPLLQRHARTLMAQQCDLWLFPSQDVVSYQVPLPSLVSILDLAHRYEKNFPETASMFNYRFNERTFSSICRWGLGFFVGTETGRQQVINAYGVSPEKIHLLPFVPPAYIHNTAVPAGFAERYRLPAKYLFYPAQFWTHKNHRNLLLAFARLKSEFPDLRLVLAGSKKNAYDAVIALIAKLGLTGDVTILGYVPNEDIPELYRRARALVMPTYFGPSNIPPLEAAILGCPVAISNVSSMPEQLGNAALVFDPDSVGEIADCIRRLWHDDQLCHRLATEARQRVAAWGQKEFNDQLHRILVSMAGHRTGSGRNG